VECRRGRACVEGECRPADCAADRFEDDDSPGRAARLAARWFPDLLQCGDETDDWFSTEIPAGHGVLAILRADPSDELDLAAYAPGPGGEPVLEMAGAGMPGTRWVARSPREAASVALLRVVGLSAATLPYSLDLRHVEAGPCVDDDADRRPGDETTQPLPDSADALVLCPGDRDEYEVDLEAESIVIVELTPVDGHGELRGRILGPDGELTADLVAEGDGLRAEVPVDADGRWSVVVAGDAPPAGVRYRLQVRTVIGEVRRLCDDAQPLEPGARVNDLAGPASELTASCSESPGPAHVWQLQLDAPRSVRLEVAGATVALRRSCAAPESELACDAALIQLPAAGPGLLSVVVVGPPEGGPYWLTLSLGEPAPPPENDACEAATPLEPGKVVHGSTWTALDDATAAECPETQQGAPDVFYRLELAEETLLETELLADFAARSYLLEECGGAPVACLPGPTLLTSGSWWIAVDGRSPGEQGAFRLTTRTEPPPPPPANAACEGAFVVRPGETVRADTRRGGVARVPATCGPAGQSGRELAFRLPQVPVAIAALDAEFDALLYVVDGCGEARPEVLCRAAGRSAVVRIERPGPEAVLFVDGASPEEAGDFSLRVTEPAGDEQPCGDDPLQLPVELGGSTGGASPDLDPGAGCAGPFPLPGPEVTFPLSVGAGEEIEAVLRPAGWDGALYLLDACGDGEPACLAGSDSGLAGEEERLAWTAADAGVVWLVVDAFAGSGDFRLSVHAR